MTRKQFFGSFIAGVAGLGAMASGKVDELPTVTSGRVLQMQEENLSWADSVRAAAEWKPHPAQLKAMIETEKHEMYTGMKIDSIENYMTHTSDWNV